jgi:hypothetical protein
MKAGTPGDGWLAMDALSAWTYNIAEVVNAGWEADANVQPPADESNPRDHEFRVSAP